VQKKDWPINVDKRNENRKYAAYTEQEVAAVLQVANSMEEGLTRFLAGTGFRLAPDNALIFPLTHDKDVGQALEPDH
jgi:hypothetical protein